MQKNRLNKKGAGFTLIELLVVIAIIGLLSTLAIVALDSAREKSRDSKRVTDVRQMQTALELFFNDEENYPLGEGTVLGEGTDCTGSACTCLTSNGFEATCTGSPTYMAQLPLDPVPNDTVSYGYQASQGGGICLDAGGSDPAVNCSTYTICFTLEGQVNELSGGSYTASPEGFVQQACPF